ncbi:MAG TPA: cyclic nucleotide-binding domain-containing protein [Solirubrobacteraceae bacterium]|nr:cyclic nucleotide-binding domain-containing protein [Solirubrobacteraceae bacterium]
MSESDVAVVAAYPDESQDIALLLGDMPLFAGIPQDELADLASAFTRLSLGPGELLWRQGTPVDGLHVIVTGEAQVCRRLPGERELELARIGAGDVLGEVPLLGGGTHSASVRALSPVRLLFLDRAEFGARMLSRQPGALELRRRIVAIACDRLRKLHGALVQSAAARDDGVGSTPAAAPATTPVAEVPAPSLAYVSRLPLFRNDPGLATMLLQAGRTVHVPRGRVMVRAGEPPTTFHVTLNGAVEDVLAVGSAQLRVGLAGPGRAFGYLGLLDGGDATMTSVARERSTILTIAAERFATLCNGNDERSRTLAAAVQSDLMLSLRDAGKPLIWAGSLR